MPSDVKKNLVKIGSGNGLLPNGTKHHQSGRVPSFEGNVTGNAHGIYDIGLKND